jgi:hypothetical protein
MFERKRDFISSARRCGDPGLILHVKAEKAGTLSAQDKVVFARDINRQKLLVHPKGRLCRNVSTVTSSRPRVKSRYSAPLRKDRRVVVHRTGTEVENHARGNAVAVNDLGHIASRKAGTLEGF